MNEEATTPTLREIINIICGTLILFVIIEKVSKK